MIDTGLQIKERSIAAQQQHSDRAFPLVLINESRAPLGDATAWLEANAHGLIQRARDHGAILFRDFPVASAEDFDAFLSAFGLTNFPYAKSLSNAVRINRTERVFTANEAPSDIEIFMHHEMAQTPIFPTRIFFCCLDPADEGGETPICRSDILLDRLRTECPDFVRACREKGLKYSNVMPSENDLASGMGRSWQSTLGADSREQAESRLRQLNYSWQWQDDGCLRATTPVLPAVRELESGRSVFFNQLIAAFRGWKDSRNDPSRSIRHGDGGPLDVESVRRAVDIAYDLSYDVQWQHGDVALVDNLMVMHGRRPFKGTRCVLASLAVAQTHEQPR